jgi:hypothetical protein
MSKMLSRVIDILNDATGNFEEDDAMELEGIIDCLEGFDFSERFRKIDDTSDYAHTRRPRGADYGRKSLMTMVRAI